MTAAASKVLPLTFSGGAAVVTGAASGIGAAIAKTLMSAEIRTVRLDVRTPDPDPDFDSDLQVGVGADVRDGDLVERLDAAGIAVDDIVPLWQPTSAVARFMNSARAGPNKSGRAL